MFSAILEHYVLGFNAFIAVYLMIYALILVANTVYGAVVILREERRESLHNVLEHDFYYPVSILIPVHNEGACGLQTVENVLKQDYRLFEVVVIDDGSTDDTLDLMVSRFSLEREFDRPVRYLVPCQPIEEIYTGRYAGRDITLVRKVNGGAKADAINAGINVCSFPYFLNMDGDEILQKDALVRAVRSIMRDDKVIAVGGNIRISNNVEFKDAMPAIFHFGAKTLPDVQTLEYGRSFAGSRILHNHYNANLIISGGYGVFKKDAVVEVGGYDTKSLGEDFEMTMRLHRHFRDKGEPYLMEYVEDSVCWTQAPETYADLRKQRVRWQRGLIETLAAYRHMILNPAYGVVGMLMLPHYVVYELLAPTVMVLGWLAIAASVYLDTVNVPFVVFVYLYFVAFSIALTVLSCAGNCYRKRERMALSDVARIICAGLYEAFVFRMALSLILFANMFRKGRASQGWESPRRVRVKS